MKVITTNKDIDNHNKKNDIDDNTVNKYDIHDNNCKNEHVAKHRDPIFAKLLKIH